MPKFQTRVVPVDAIQWTGENLEQVKDWLQQHNWHCSHAPSLVNQWLWIRRYLENNAIQLLLSSWLVSYGSQQVEVLSDTQFQARIEVVPEEAVNAQSV